MTEQFRNGSGYKFKDISRELVREYHFTDGVLRIDEPEFLYVSKSGGHRVFSVSGKCFYVSPTWLWIEWRARPDKPHFCC